ncbi:hypothetical protein [Streptomyces sp. NPDC001933]|uniref:hypothetical protein n=1 Tax=Streptomyces sp. NPDC001933 TaxID=3364626 RepID=UPI0036D18E9B
MGCVARVSRRELDARDGQGGGGRAGREFDAAAFEGRAWFTEKTFDVTEGLRSATFTHDPTLIG